jgi:rhamnose utilization protein RhaD (predicted bifunctional aldolase and dehydrogenase)
MIQAELNNLVEISRYYGKNKEYVIAGGGNTSYKDDNFLWVKASGVSLEQIMADGFVCLSREKLKLVTAKKYSNDVSQREIEVKNDLNEAVVTETGRRPSVEASLHNLIDYPFVVHTHPTLVNSLLCSVNAKDLTSEILGNDVLFIEYTDPGYILFKKVSDELSTFKEKKGFSPQVILLENHGIIVSGTSIGEIKRIYQDIEKAILDKIKVLLPICDISDFESKVATMVMNVYPNHGKLFFATAACDLINGFVKNSQSFVAVDTAYTPDHIVYCKSHYLFMEDVEKKNITDNIAAFKEKYGYLPKVVAIKNKGLLIVEENQASAEIVLELILNMMKISHHARLLGGSKPMTPTQIAFIENWEAENYRKQMSK